MSSPRGNRHAGRLPGGGRAAQPAARPTSAGAGDGHRRELALLGERLAGEHLERLGFALLERGARTRAGEIDLIAFDGRTLVFAEVKTRRVRAGAAVRADQQPLAGLRERQRARVRRLAVAWLADRGRPRAHAREIRFDALGVLVGAHGELLALEHLEAAW